MSKPLTQTELLRAEWLTRLSTQQHRQIHGLIRNIRGGVCAVGLLHEILAERGIPAHGNDNGRFVGLHRDDILVVTSLNDGWVYFRRDGTMPPRLLPHVGEGCVRNFQRRTFAEIRDIVAGWFAK